MIDRGLKIVLAMSVLLGGTAAALLFRRAPAQLGPPPAPLAPLVLRERGGAAGASSLGAPTARIESSESVPRTPEAPVRPPSVLAPLDPGAPPPIMAKSYPQSAPVITPRWGTSMALGPAGGADFERAARTHRIADGDTLEALAQRYLGSADRAMEIFEANRYVLPGPMVLPIGVELKIPPRRPPAEPSVDPAAHGPLVPIPPSSLRRPRATSARARGAPAWSDGDR